MAVKTENKKEEDINKDVVPSVEQDTPEDVGTPTVTFKDAPKTSEEMEDEKKQFQQFSSGNMNVKGSQAENLFIVQNAIIDGNVSLGGYAVREVLHNGGKVDKEYDLSDAEQFADFGETVKAGEHFAIAIILCVFEYVELNDLQDLKSKLLLELPEVTDAEGKEIAVSLNAYLSVNSLLKTIKGEMVVLNSGEQCIRLATNRPSALKNLWLQFPEIRGHIARWLLNVSDAFQNRTNFNSVQITMAFVNLMKLDFMAGVNQFFPRLYSMPNMYWLLSFIALELYNDPAYHDKILPHIKNWAESGSSWLWKAAIFVYANIKHGEESDGLEKRIKKVLSSQYDQISYDDLHIENLSYVGMLMIGSERLRTLVASVLGTLMRKTQIFDNNHFICLSYLGLLRYGYYLVSFEMPALPLVACDKKQQLEDLLPILEMILFRYDTRQLLFVTLKPYLKEISRYDLDKKTINHLKAFFLLTAESNQQFYEDIDLFLKDCDCCLAKELGRFLDENLGSTTNKEDTDTKMSTESDHLGGLAVELASIQ